MVYVPKRCAIYNNVITTGNRSNERALQTWDWMTVWGGSSNTFFVSSSSILLWEEVARWLQFNYENRANLGSKQSLGEHKWRQWNYSTTTFSFSFFLSLCPLCGATTGDLTPLHNSMHNVKLKAAFLLRLPLLLCQWQKMLLFSLQHIA